MEEPVREEAVAEESALDLYLASSDLLQRNAEPVAPVEPAAETPAESAARPGDGLRPA